MPSKPPLACPRPRCPHLQPCPDHPSRWAEGARGYRRPPGADALARYILARDLVCVMCGAAPSTEVHHLEPRDDRTAVGVCSQCHRKITQGQAAAARWPGQAAEA